MAHFQHWWMEFQRSKTSPLDYRTLSLGIEALSSVKGLDPYQPRTNRPIRKLDMHAGRYARSPSVSGENNMNLHTPSVPLFIVSLVLAALALIGHFVLLPFVTLYGFWVAIIAYVILAAGIVMKT